MTIGNTYHTLISSCEFSDIFKLWSIFWHFCPHDTKKSRILKKIWNFYPKPKKLLGCSLKKKKFWTSCHVSNWKRAESANDTTKDNKTWHESKNLESLEIFGGTLKIEHVPISLPQEVIFRSIINEITPYLYSKLIFSTQYLLTHSKF